MNKTSRITVDSLENIMFKQFPVLDKGLVEVVDYMGGDESIPNAARTSYQAGTKTVNNDRGLIRYLMRNSHSSPFEFPRITLRVKAPLFVFAQWVRHRTQSINCQSARYSVMLDEFYIPSKDNMKPQSKSNKQGREGELTEKQISDYLEAINTVCETSYKTYEQLLNQSNGEVLVPDVEGLSRELARMVLPQNLYTNWVYTTDLHNLFHFLRLRADSHAQYEIRVYADLICDIVKQWVPIAYEAFEDYRLNAMNLSSMEVDMLKDFMNRDETIIQFSDDAFEYWNKGYGISKREYNEFRNKLNLT